MSDFDLLTSGDVPSNNNFGSTNLNVNIPNDGSVAFNSFVNSFNKPSFNQLSQPLTYDPVETQRDRYQGSEYYNELGFNPFGNNEERYGQRQTVMNKLKNAFVGAGVLAAEQAWEQFKSWGDTVDTIKNLSISFEESDMKEIYDRQQKFNNEYPIYQTQEDMDSIVNWSNVASTIQQSGYAVGAIGEILAEELALSALTAATFGGTSELQGLRTASLIGETVKKAEQLSNAIQDSNKLRKIFSTLSKNTPVFGNTLDYLNTFKSIKQADELASGSKALLRTASKGFGAFYRDVRELNVALSEAKAEASTTYGSLVEDLTRQFEQEKGRTPNAFEQEDINKTAIEAANVNGAANTALIMLTNKIIMDNALKGFKPYNKIIEDDIMKGVTVLSDKEALKTGTKMIESSTNPWLRFKNSLYKQPFAAIDYTAANITEALQENLQNVSNSAVTNYYKAKYSGQDSDWLKDIKSAAQEQFSIDGAKTFISGFVTGGILSGGGKLINKAESLYKSVFDKTAYQADKAEQKTRRADFINNFNNAWNNPLSFTLDREGGFTTQVNMNNLLKQAAATGDKKSFNDIQDDAKSMFILQGIRTNTLDIMLDRLDDYTKNLKPEEFTKAFDLDYSEDTYNGIVDKIQDFKSYAKDTKKAYESLNQQYKNPFNPFRFKSDERDTPEYKKEVLGYMAHQNAIEHVVFMGQTYKSAIKRQNDILNGIKEVPGMENVSFSNITKLSDYQSLLDEIITLRSEVNGQLDPKIKTKKEKELSTLVEYAMEFNNYQGELIAAYDSLSGKKLVTQVNKIKKKYSKSLSKGVTDYLNIGLKENNKESLNKKAVKGVMDRFFDYYDLHAESDILLKNVEVLTDPKGFNQLLTEHIDELTKIQEKKSQPENNSQESTKENSEQKPEKLPEEPEVNTTPQTNTTPESTTPEPKSEPIKPVEQPAKFEPVTSEIVEIDGGDVKYYQLQLSNGMTTSDQLEKLFADNGIELDGMALVSAFNSMGDSVTTDKKAIEEDKKTLDKYLNQYNSLFAPFEFKGKTFTPGETIVNRAGEPYEVVKKSTANRKGSKVDVIILKNPRNNKNVEFEDLTQFTPEAPKQEKPTTYNFRLSNPYDITRSYGHRLSREEDQKVADQRLHDFIVSTPKEDLLKNITVRVVRRTIPAETKPVQDNPYLYQNSEPFSIQILYKGEPIGYVSYFDKYSYRFPDGKLVPIHKVGVQYLKNVFDMKGKQPSVFREELLSAYSKGSAFYNTISQKLGDKTSIELSNDEINRLFDFDVRSGRYDFGTRTPFNELNYTTLDGEIIVLDKTRIADDKYDQPYIISTPSPSKVSKLITKIEAKFSPDALNQYGRLVAFVGLPNGDIKAVELGVGSPDQGKVDSMLATINDVISVDGDISIKDLQRANEAISNTIYIANDKGSTIDIAITEKKNVKFTYFKKESNGTTTRRSSVAPIDGKIKSLSELINLVNQAIENHDSKTKTNKLELVLKPTDVRAAYPMDLTAEGLKSLDLYTNVGKGVTKAASIRFVPKTDVVPVVESQNKVDIVEAPVVKTETPVSIKELEDRLEAIKNEEIQKLVDSGLNRIQAKVLSAQSYENNPEVIRIKNQIKNSAAKISTLNKGQVENIDRFREWVRAKLPDNVTVEEVNMITSKMVSGSITVGAFYSYLDTLGQQQGKIQVSKESPFKYHEAFHAIFRLSLDEATIVKLLNYAKVAIKKEGISLKKGIQDMIDTNPIYYSAFTAEELENRFYEEYLADKFDAWKHNDKVEALPVHKNFFQRLWEFIKNFFTVKDEALSIFRDIEAGKFKNSRIVYNRFRLEPFDVSVPDVAYKAIKIGDKVLQMGDEIFRVPTYLSQKEGSKLISNIVSTYQTRRETSDLSKAQLLKEIFDDYAEMYQLETTPGSGQIKPHYEAYFGGLSDAEVDSKFDKIQILHKVLTDENIRKELIDAVNTHISIMEYRDESAEDEMDDLWDDYGKGAIDFTTEGYSKGGWKSLSKFLRRYIATATIPVQVDEFGNTELKPGVPLIEAADADTVYNGLLKAVANVTDTNQFIERLMLTANNNHESSIFINKFIADTGLFKNEDGQWEITRPEKANVLQSVLKGLQQYTVDYLFINKDLNKKEVRISKANYKDSARTQFDMWYEGYKNKFVNNPNYDNYDWRSGRSKWWGYMAGIIQTGTTPYTNEKELEDDINDIVNNIFESFGIYISPLTVRFSYAKNSNSQFDLDIKLREAFPDVEPFTFEDAQYIGGHLKGGKNPFEKSFGKGENKGAEGRLLNIARVNAIFDENVSTTSFINAENKVVYGHQQPTFDLVQATRLRDENFRKKLLEDPFLADNPLLTTEEGIVALEQGEVIRIDGVKSSKFSDVTGDEDKNLAANQNEGITYGSMSDREMAITLIDSYNYQKQLFVKEGDQSTTGAFVRPVLTGVLEASNTGDMVMLPETHRVKLVNGRVGIHEKTIEFMTNEVKREADRIQRAYKEIQEGGRLITNSDGTQQRIIIDGYHNGKQPRGTRFYFMKHFLNEELIKALEKQGADFEEFREDVKSAVEFSLLSDIDRFIDLLSELQIVENVDGVVTNKLLGDFINGKGSKKDTFYLEEGNVKYNLAHIFVNNLTNAISYNQLLDGDAAENYKDDGGVDPVKRYKGRNAQGPSIVSTVVSHELGIHNVITKSHGVIFRDPVKKSTYSTGNVKQADAQMYITEKFLRYALFGLGKLTKHQQTVLDNIRDGKSETIDVFGKNGSINFDAQTNSIKLIYFDGKKYVKTSGFLLSKESTSYKKGDRWYAYPNRKELHDLREKLESYEERNNTITFGIPESAAKGLKPNISTDVSSVSDNNFTEYDNNFWRLQLENPSNKKTITDPTQAKQIILSEQTDDLEVIYDGKPMKIRDIKNKYLTASSDRLKTNYLTARDEIFNIDGAFNELKESITTNQVTPKMGKFLERAVESLVASKSDSQLIDFFTPQKVNGEPEMVYDLNNPVTIDKFVQLFLAHFSKGVIGEKVPGHSLTLVSNYGFEVVREVLEVDENGTPTKTRLVRQHEVRSSLVKGESKFNSENLKRWSDENNRTYSGLNVGDYILDDLRHNVPEYNDKGEIVGYYSEAIIPAHKKGMDNLEELPDDLKKAFGVRIPSQDKHSFIAIKIVDTLPAHYGSIGVFPHELVEISGADFDVDKLYMQITDFYKKDGQYIPYGSAVTPEEKYYEYIASLFVHNKPFKRKVQEIKNLNIDDIDLRFEVLGDEESNVVEFIGEVLKDWTNSVEYLALKEFGLPTSVEEYTKFVEKYGEQNVGVLNNEVLKTRLALYNNEAMVKSDTGTPVAFTPATVDLLKEDILKEFKTEFPELSFMFEEGGALVHSMTGQIKSFKNNKEGSRLIGPAVNSMLSYNLLQTYGVKLRTGIETINIDGMSFNSYESPFTVDGSRKADLISTVVSAMTDNAKERLAAKFGLNMDSTGILCDMVARGIPMRTALYFTLQPCVREFYQRMKLYDYKLTTSEEDTTKKEDRGRSAVGKALLKNYEEQLGDSVEPKPITTDLLKENIHQDGSDMMTQYSILSAYLNFRDQSKYFSAVAQVLKLSKGLSTNFEDLQKIKDKIDFLGLNMTDEEMNESDIPFDLRPVFNQQHTMSTTALDIVKELDTLSKTVFLERTELFRSVFDFVSNNMNPLPSIRDAFNNTLKKDLIAYLGIKAYYKSLLDNNKGGRLRTLNSALIFDKTEVGVEQSFNDIIDLLFKLREVAPDNYFVNNFITSLPLNKDGKFNPESKGINVVETNTWARLSLLEQEKIQDSVKELFKNSETYEYLVSLFNYLLVKDGGQYKNGSFLRMLPIQLFDELSKATGSARKVMSMETIDDNEFKKIFGLTTSELFKEFSTNFFTHQGNRSYIKTIRPDENTTDKSVAGFKNSKVIEVANGKLYIDLFGGIRSTISTPAVTEDGRFDIVTIRPEQQGSFTEDESNNLKYNKAQLAAKRFELITEETDGKTKVVFPYVVKMGSKSSTKYYKLAKVEREDKSLELIDPAENKITGVSAVYVEFQPLGTSYNWSQTAMFGKVPTWRSTAEKYKNNRLDSIDDIEHLLPDLDVLDNIDNLAGLEQYDMLNPTQTESQSSIDYNAILEKAKQLQQKQFDISPDELNDVLRDLDGGCTK